MNKTVGAAAVIASLGGGLLFGFSIASRPLDTERPGSKSAVLKPDSDTSLQALEVSPSSAATAPYRASRPDESPEHREALRVACFQLAETNPRQAVELAIEHGLDPDAVLQDLVRRWAERNIDTATIWIASQPSGKNRDALVTGVAYVWSKTHPSAAADYIVKLMSPGPQLEETAIMVLHQWALSDYESAELWAKEFPKGATRDRALKELLGIASYR